MNEKINSKKEENSAKDNQDIAALLKKMQDKLDSMEDKIDSLVTQSKQKTFEGRRFSKPRKEYDKTKHHKERKYEGKKEEVTSEGKFYHGRPFAKKKAGGKSNLNRKKKSYNKSSQKNQSVS